MSDTDLKRVRAAQSAVRTFYGMREDLPDSDDVRETCAEILSTSKQAVSAGRPMTNEEWIELAEMVDETCDGEALPRLFEKVPA